MKVKKKVILNAKLLFLYIFSISIAKICGMYNDDEKIILCDKCNKGCYFVY